MGDLGGQSFGGLRTQGKYVDGLFGHFLLFEALGGSQPRPLAFKRYAKSGNAYERICCEMDL